VLAQPREEQLERADRFLDVLEHLPDGRQQRFRLHTKRIRNIHLF
jgi:hypothetical protein